MLEVAWLYKVALYFVSKCVNAPAVSCFYEMSLKICVVSPARLW